jgi:hypothetical protein
VQVRTPEGRGNRNWARDRSTRGGRNVITDHLFSGPDLNKERGRLEPSIIESQFLVYRGRSRDRFAQLVAHTRVRTK